MSAVSVWQEIVAKSRGNLPQVRQPRIFQQNWAGFATGDCLGKQNLREVGSPGAKDAGLRPVLADRMRSPSGAGIWGDCFGPNDGFRNDRFRCNALDTQRSALDRLAGL